MTRVALLDRLKQLQHMPNFQGRDITTISALLSNEALADHVRVCEDAVSAPPNGGSVGDDSRALLGRA
ncbi:hypothetical protein [Chelativorans salis]|uniref:Uncharacterized protein n=1 Tax=Chelativorans salis TaxID=2978478 RepID=A0ABT2LUZ7_9HYPH|nr:hypothetical protein [Chelativorans sp. EGI FJ00035]MCT7378339.1 hypothetical protein [Chelativorans sp. EGI FJ00035]